MKTLAARLQKNSTIVLFSDLTRGLRAAALTLASNVAPARAADLLIDFWSTTRRLAPGQNEVEALRTAHPFTITVDGHKLKAWSWGEGPTILCVHGWNGRGGQFYKFVPELVRAGYSVVVFDAHGHGESEGTHSNLLELSRTVLNIANQVGAVGLVGHSFGALAISVALNRGLGPIPAVFLSSPADPLYFFEKFADFMGIPRKLRSLILSRAETRLGMKWKDLQLLEFAPRMKSALLILQDPSDSEVPWSHANQVAQLWPKATLTPFPGVGHYRILKSPEAIQSAVEHFLKHAPTPHP